MIRKILTLTLCLILFSCVGFNSSAGLKFETGNEVVKLKNGELINFETPIGDCGAKVVFFGILLPVIPIWFRANSCEKSFDIAFNSIVGNPKLWREANIKLKYRGDIHDPITVEKISEYYYMLRGEQNLQYDRKFKFRIDDFRKFKTSDDKAIIISGKIDGKKFTEELPVRWGVILYKNPSIPSW
jgi:hypothetical protein